MRDKPEPGAARVRRFYGEKLGETGERSESKSRRSQDAGKGWLALTTHT